MRPILIVLFLPLVLPQINVRIQLQNGKQMSLEKFTSALQAADVAFAGEPFSNLVSYEDQVVQVRALENVCAGGYYWSADKCVMCGCSNVGSTVDRVNFKPLDLSSI